MNEQLNNEKLINGVSVYFKILDDINTTALKLIQSKNNNPELIANLFYHLSIQISRIIPIKYKQLEKDGILQLRKYFEYLYDNYKNLFEEMQETLFKINDIRNKFEHEPHNISWNCFLGNDEYKEIHFVYIKYDEEEMNNKKKRTKWIIHTEELAELIKKLDEIYLKTREELLRYIDNNIAERLYTKRILELDLKSFILDLEQYL